MNQTRHIPILNRAIRKLFFDVLRISLLRPRFFFRVSGLFITQIRAAHKRRGWRKSGVIVPPMMIASITRRCNLRCTGCYAAVLHKNDSAEMSGACLERLVAQAYALGFSFILCAGGERRLWRAR